MPNDTKTKGVAREMPTETETFKVGDRSSNRPRKLDPAIRDPTKETTMNKIIIALGIALASSTAAFAQSSALDVIGQPAANAPLIDTVETGSITTNLGVDATENRDRLGDGSPMMGGAQFGSVAIDTGYLPAPRLGGNS
jgi:hypothetical protein